MIDWLIDDWLMDWLLIEVKKICMQLMQDADNLESACSAVDVVKTTWREGAEVIDDGQECMEVAIADEYSWGEEISDFLPSMEMSLMCEY